MSGIVGVHNLNGYRPIEQEMLGVCCASVAIAASRVHSTETKMA